MKISVNDTGAKSLLRRYASLAKVEIADAVKDEARLTAKRLVALTPPKTAAQGKKRVSIDIGKVYMMPQWFTDTFQFSAVKFGERIKELITKSDSSALNKIFQASGKLAKITIEPFKSSLIQRFRKHGRVNKNVSPLSLSLNDMSNRKAYEERKKRNVGLVKSGWSNCLRDLGGTAAGWLNKSGTGKAIVSPPNETPSVTLINYVDYAADLERKGIVRTAVQGRQKDLANKIKAQLRNIKR